MAEGGCISWTLRPRDPENHETATPIEVSASQTVVADVECKLDVLKQNSSPTIKAREEMGAVGVGVEGGGEERERSTSAATPAAGGGRGSECRLSHPASRDDKSR